MTDYTSVATRIASGWRLQCREVPGAISSVRRLDQAEEAQREAIAFVADVEESSLGEIHLVVELDPRLSHQRDELSAIAAEASRLRGVESAMRAELVRDLLDRELPMRDVGRILGISHQRVAQIAKGS